MTRVALIAGVLLMPHVARAYRPFGTDADLEVGPLQAERVHGDTTYVPGGLQLRRTTVQARLGLTWAFEL